MTGRFRCSLASAQRDDELAGTASTVRAFLLVECIGSWGVDALRDSPRRLRGRDRHAELKAGCHEPG